MKNTIINEAELVGGPLDGATIPPYSDDPLPSTIDVNPDLYEGKVRAFATAASFNPTTWLRYAYHGLCNAVGKPLYHHAARV